MPGQNDNALDILIANGLVSLVRTDDALKITSCRGKAAEALPVGAKLCEAVPVLFGMDDQIRSLRRFAGRKVVMSNMSVIERDGSSGRQDFVVMCDHAQGGYLLSIMPSLANDVLAIDLEQSLRNTLQLEMKEAAQARAIEVINQSLERTNADLINFTRMISHDLKAPMRAIRYSAEDIETALGDTGDPEQLQALDQLQAQSRRLSRMVSDLLVYSRLEDKNVVAAPIDTDAMVREIAQSLPRPEKLRLEIKGTWPQITTIGVMLDVVLRNLLDNAIKHHDSGQGLIAVSAKTVDGFLNIEVCDDGPGIPKDYQEAVLRPFIRVKPNETRGSGMGLSMVKKVVDDAGGRINVGDRADGLRGVCIVVGWPLTNVTA